jgi:DNA-binding NtrC family response regulator
MLESVCIVLNEREPAKAKAAELLQQQLKKLDITSSRIEIDAQIEDVVLKNRSPVLVLDYLLGDYSTGLDLLSATFAEKDNPPAVFFLTDEPSISVAVNAMRSGAKNYFELSNPQAINQLCSDIQLSLSHLPRNQPKAPKAHLKFGELVENSKARRELHEQARSIAIQRTPIIVISGEKGSGKKTLARAIYEECYSTSFLEEIDLSTYCGSFEKLLRPVSVKSSLKLGHNLSIIVSGAANDNGDLLDLIADDHEKLWPNKSDRNNYSCLIVCSNDKDDSMAWQKLTEARLLEVPSINGEQREDIPALVQRFSREAANLCEQKHKSLPSEVVEWLTQLSWPGNIAQLRTTVIDAIVTMSFSERGIKEIIEYTKILWETFNNPEQEQHIKQPFSRYGASRLLEIYGFNYRVTAAKLGCTVDELYKSLKTSEAALEVE